MLRRTDDIIYPLLYMSKTALLKKNKQTHTKSTGYRQAVLYKLASIRVISQVTNQHSQCCENLISHNMDQITFRGRFLIQ
jgi:hypothetical protein